MNYKLLRAFLIGFILSIQLNELLAQEGIVATGKEISGTNGTMSYSIGQVCYHSYSGNGKTMAEGVQQPFIIKEVTGVLQNNILDVNLWVFPNPVSNVLNLEVPDVDLNDFNYKIFNTTGILIEQSKINTSHTIINTESMNPSMYLLNIYKDNQIIKTFKIIKQ